MGNKTSSPPQSPQIPQTSPTPTTNPTENWRTYTNSQYGYSIKYPLNYKEDTSLQNLSVSNPLWMQNTFFYSNNPQPGGGEQPWISVIVWNKDVNLLEDWFKKHASVESFDSEKLPSGEITLYFGVSGKEEVKLGSMNGFKFTSQTMNGPVERIIVDQNQYVYEVSLWTNNNLRRNPDIKKVYDQILSTFQFLN